LGKPSPYEDAERLEAVRAAVGSTWEIMVDANQSLTGADAIRRARSYEPLDIAWFEEPLPADDLAGYLRLARSTSVPIAVGESIYSVGRFAEYLAAGATGIVQVDVARVGGITPWLKVAHTAEAFNVRVAPRFLMKLHAGLACAVPAGMYVEYIPQLAAITRIRFADSLSAALSSWILARVSEQGSPRWRGGPRSGVFAGQDGSSRVVPGGAGGTRTHGRRIMSPLL
jgi:L-alanine-DL-glutamate epimerase-like enolase superfamily enzyme